MLKHNKKRNTAFLFETLVREVTLNTISGNDKKRDIAINLLKTFFKKDTEMSKELSLYKNLLETKEFPKELCVKLLEETKAQHRKLNKKKLYEEHSLLIASLNRAFGNEFFLNYVPEYKTIASINQIFKNDATPMEKVLLENYVISLMTTKQTFVDNKLEDEDKINNLVLRNFIEKYNTKYSILSENQRKILNKFILSEFDNSSFIETLNEEIQLTKDNLNNLIKENKYKSECEIVLSKIDLLKEKKIGLDEVILILETQEFIREIQNDSNNN